MYGDIQGNNEEGWGDIQDKRRDIEDIREYIWKYVEILGMSEKIWGVSEMYGEILRMNIEIWGPYFSRRKGT